MTVTVNGQTRDITDGMTVAQVVATLGLGMASGVAVAVNGEVVRRGAWPTHTLDDGDRVEVLNAVQGG